MYNLIYSYGASSISKTASGTIGFFFSKHGVRRCASLVNVHIEILENQIQHLQCSQVFYLEVASTSYDAGHSHLWVVCLLIDFIYRS